jgi:VIT1/CCC1 family predicted Fe2+/Mn2+ transporter
MSMAVGEYVSVSAQRDSEQADIELEQQALKPDLTPNAVASLAMWRIA